MSRLMTVAVSLCLAMGAGGVLAQDAMKKDAMGKGEMGKGEMMKGEMKKDMMKKDGMAKKDDMKMKGEMKKDMAHDLSKTEKGKDMKMEKKDMMKGEMKK